MKIWYPDAFLNLTLTQFSDLIHALKASRIKYGESTVAK